MRHERFHLGSVTTDLVPEPLEYAVLEPASRPSGPLPSLLVLHGGAGSRDYLNQVRHALDVAWNSGGLPPCVAVTPSAGASLFMDSCDGLRRYESAILGPLMDDVAARFKVSRERADTIAVGVSVGGLGALRMAFKHPDRFAGVAAVEPAVEPVLDYADLDPEDRFWRDPAVIEEIYGSPVDAAYWRANHPTAMVVDDPEPLRKHGLEILIECGDADSFGLFRGTELLHRALYDAGIQHDYRLVRGADHIGATLPGRFAAALLFLGRVLVPPGPDVSLGPFHEYVAGLRAKAGLP